MHVVLTKPFLICLDILTTFLQDENLELILFRNLDSSLITMCETFREGVVRFSCNSEAYVSELQANREEMLISTETRSGQYSLY